MVSLIQWRSAVLDSTQAARCQISSLAPAGIAEAFVAFVVETGRLSQFAYCSAMDLLPAGMMVLNAAACLPDGAVALEAPSKAQLPDAVALVDAACVLQISQYVPGRHKCL